MADEKTPASDPSSSSYGATVQNPPYPTADTTAYPTPQPPMPPPVGSPPYPTPQMNQEAPLNNFPTEPPPKYEPPKGAYPPQQPYPPSGYQQGAIIPPPITTQGTTIVVGDVMGDPGFSPCPRTILCPNCNAFVTTAINYQSGLLTWLAAGVICFFGCWAGCCLIPFCMPDCQDVEHRCPNCATRVGLYRRL